MPDHEAAKKGPFAFHALLSRMKYIRRWSLMRCTRTETLGEHTAEAAQIAYTLCCVNNALFGGDARADAVAAAALFHDAPEVITGDLPTPVKYRSEDIRAAYGGIEHQAVDGLLHTLPAPLCAGLERVLRPDHLTQTERRLLKAADRLSAVIKCLGEQNSGNREFDSACRQQMQALEQMACAEADWFIGNMLPAYGLTLDELTGRL